MKLFNKSIFAIFSVAALIMIANPAQAIVMNGNMCVASNGSQAGSFTRSPTGIKNVSGGARWVTCQLDKTGIGAGATPTIIVGATNTGTANQLACTVDSVVGYAGIAASATTTFPAGISFTSLNSVMGGQLISTYSIECLLPAGSTIQAIFATNNI